MYKNSSNEIHLLFPIFRYMIELPNWIIIVFVLILIIIILYKVYSNKAEPTHIDKVLNNKSKTIIDIIKYNSNKYHKYIALKIKNGKNDWKEIKYNQYYDNILNFAQSTNYWLGAGVNVGIMGFNSPGWFYAHLGSMLNGGVSVGCNPNNTENACEYILNDSNVELLVVENDEQLNKICNIDVPKLKLIVYYSPITETTIKKFNIPVFSMGTFMANKTSEYILPKLNNNATIIYTSGRTGKPKGVILTHKNIMTSINNILKCITSKSNLKDIHHEQFISYLPLSHILAQIMDIYIPIITIGTVWFADKNILKSSLQTTLYEIKPTIFIGVPRVWEKIMEGINEQINKKGISGKLTKFFSPSKIVEKIGLDKCKLAISTGSQNSQLSYDFFNSLGISIYDIYGLSETCGPITISLPGLSQFKSVGFPIMNVKIAKDNEILVKGDNLFKGYTDKKLNKLSYTKDKWFRTGDFGYMENGFLFINDKKKELTIKK
jgi:long-chain-fatty-acid--CoA ligase ACSBG